MQPIHELLSRIRWDEAFGKGDFEIAYLERGQGHLERVSLENVEPLSQLLTHVVHQARPGEDNHSKKETPFPSRLFVGTSSIMTSPFIVYEKCTRTKS